MEKSVTLDTLRRMCVKFDAVEAIGSKKRGNLTLPEFRRIVKDTIPDVPVTNEEVEHLFTKVLLLSLLTWWRPTKTIFIPSWAKLHFDRKSPAPLNLCSDVRDSVTESWRWTNKFVYYYYY